jgi:ribonuclease P protein component
MRRSLTREERLRTRDEIRDVLSRGKRVGVQGMRLSYLPTDLHYARIVVIPARGFGTAVRRNLCRRHGKEAFRALKPMIKPGFDLAIMCFPGEYTFTDRLNQLSSLLRKARLGTKEL